MSNTQGFLAGANPDPTPTTTLDLPADVAHQLSRSTDWLSSWWTVVVLGCVTLLIVAWLVLRLRRHRRRPGGPVVRRRIGTVATASLAIFSLLLTGLVTANAISGYVPGVSALEPALRGWGILPKSTDRWNPKENVGDATHGAVRTVEIPESAGERMSGDPAWVYTPPGFDPSAATRYPVVYLIHGSPGRPSDFFAAADAGHAMDVLIAHDIVAPMILVSVDVNGTGPSARDTECLDSTTGGSQAESYVSRTVVSWVDANLPTIPDRAHRVIGGASSGGFCALNLGLRHTETFATIMALMPYGDPGTGGKAMLSSADEIAANSPNIYIPTMSFAGPMQVFIDSGASEPTSFRDANRALAGMLIARGQHVELREEQGQGHTWAMVKAGLPYALRFAGNAVADARP